MRLRLVLLYSFVFIGSNLHSQWSSSTSQLGSDFISSPIVTADSILYITKIIDRGNYGYEIDDLTGLNLSSGGILASYSIPQPTVGGTRSTGVTMTPLGAIIIYDTVINSQSIPPNPTVSEQILLGFDGSVKWRAARSKKRLLPCSNFNTADSSMWFRSSEFEQFVLINLFTGDTILDFNTESFLNSFGVSQASQIEPHLLQCHVYFSDILDTSYLWCKKPALKDILTGNQISDDTTYYVLFDKKDYSLIKTIRRRRWQFPTDPNAIDLETIKLKDYSFVIDSSRFKLTQYFLNKGIFNNSVDTVLRMDTLWMPPDSTFSYVQLGLLNSKNRMQLVHVPYQLSFDTSSFIGGFSATYLRLYNNGSFKYDASFGISNDGHSNGFENRLQSSLLLKDGSVLVQLKGAYQQYLILIDPSGLMNFNLTIESEELKSNLLSVVYPTICVERLNFTCSKIANQIKVFDLLGSQKLSIDLNHEKGSIDLSDLTRGWYTIVISSGNDYSAHKVYKK